MQKLNILFVTHEGQFGGASKQLIVLARAFKKKGYNVTVLSPFKNSPVNQELNNNGIETISVLFGWWKMPMNIGPIKKTIFKVLYKTNRFSLFIINKKLKDHSFDVVHSNSSVVNIGAYIAKEKKARHVWHFREFNSEFLDYIDNFDKSSKFINENAQKIIYVSNSLKNHYDKNVKNNIGSVIYDGIEEISIVKFNNENMEEVNLLLAATLEENKGQATAIEAMKVLRNKGIGNVKLYLAGKDPNNYKKVLENMIKNYGLDDSIEFLGYVADMKELRKKMDLELICSKYEAFGLSTAEAMMCSKPVIGANTSATSELIINGYNGVLFEYNNAKELSEAINFFIQNPEKLEEYGKNAFNYAVKNFSNKIMIEKIEQLYQEII